MVGSYNPYTEDLVRMMETGVSDERVPVATRRDESRSVQLLLEKDSACDGVDTVWFCSSETMSEAVTF
jgi:hypothetical protein